MAISYRTSYTLHSTHALTYKGSYTATRLSSPSEEHVYLPRPPRRSLWGSPLHQVSMAWYITRPSIIQSRQTQNCSRTSNLLTTPMHIDKQPLAVSYLSSQVGYKPHTSRRKKQKHPKHTTQKPTTQTPTNLPSC